jgi:hypothetical protein
LRLKVRAPKIRFTRKVLFISVGMLALLAGSGAAALYVGADKLGAEVEVSPAGEACTTIQTMVLKTPARRLWLRKYIRMEHADGPARIRTALRVAGLLAKSNAVDLVQVSVLDEHGPTLRSEMRGRAIGAEVVIALQPRYLPDMKEPFIVRYYEGMPSEEGRYYGQRVSLDVSEIQKLMSAMRDVADKEDCAEPEKPEASEASGEQGKKNAHGEQVVKAEGEAPAGHGEKPAESGEEAQSQDHGAASEDKQAEGHEAAPAKEQSFLDSVLGMIGLGGSEEAPAEGHEAKVDDSSHAVAEDAADTSEEHAPEPAADHAEKPAGEEYAPATAAEHAEKPAEEKHAPEPGADHTAKPVSEKHAPAESEKHVEVAPSGHDAQPAAKEAH